jgi:hypothetical protein
MGPVFFDWVMGVVFRPSSTFERSRTQLRFGYWWIVLCVMTLDCVLSIFHPRVGTGVDAWSITVWSVILQDLVLFDIQGLLLLGVGRLQGWKATWPEVVKLTGLLWSFLLLSDLAVFYPGLKDMTTVELALTALFGAWYVIAAIIGIRKVAGLPFWRALLTGLVACGLWQGGTFALFWYALTHPAQ